MLGCRHIDRQRHQEHNTDGACGVVNPVKQCPRFGINRNHDVPSLCLSAFNAEQATALEIEFVVSGFPGYDFLRAARCLA